MHYEKARIRNRPIEKATREPQDSRVNFNNHKKGKHRLKAKRTINIMSAATKLNRKEKATQLEEYALTGSSTRNILIGTVKQMFERGEIRTQAAAGNLIKLIQENKMDQVNAKIAKLDRAVNIKGAKRLASEMEEEANYTTQERETTKHFIKIKTETANYQHSS